MTRFFRKMAPLVLYHFPPSAPSRVALLALRNLGLDAEIREIDLFKKEQLKDDFVKINPQHCVPTLVDDGFALWESRAIAIYLADKTSPQGHSLYPNDATQRAIINQRLYFDCGTLYPRIRAIGFPALYLGETKISDENRQKLFEAIGWVNGFLEGQSYVAGNELSLADISLLASIETFSQIGGDLSKWSNVAAWYERVKNIPGSEENESGAKVFGEAVRSRLEDRL